MAERPAINPELENLLQNSSALLNASLVSLFMELPDSHDLTCVLAIPDAHAADLKLARQARKSAQEVERQGTKMLYHALTSGNGDVLGVLGVHVSANASNPNNNALYRFVCEQAAALITHNQRLVQAVSAEQRLARERDFLIRIYEALQLLDAREAPEDQLALAASTFRDMGWSAVRIALRNPAMEASNMLVESPTTKQLPEISAAQWLDMMKNTKPFLENAYFFTLPDSDPLVMILVRTPEGQIAASVELYGAGDSPPAAEKTRPVMIFARQYGQVLDRVNLINSLRQTAGQLMEQVDELEFIRKADREISSRLDTNRIVKFSLDWAIRRAGADAGAIVTIDPAENEVVVKEILGYPVEIVRRYTPRDMPGVVGRCLRSAQTQLVEDVSTDPDYVNVLERTVTQIVIPLISNRRTLGAITLESKRAGCFSQGTIEFLERIASMTAISLDNAHLLQQAEQLADDMSLIHNAGRNISTSLDWDNTIQSVAQSMALAVRGSSAMVYDYAPHNQSSRLLAIYNGGDPEAGQPHGVPEIGSRWDLQLFEAVQKTIEANRMLIIDHDTPDSPEKDWFQGFNANAIGVLPFAAGGEPVGLAVVLKSGLHLKFESSEIFVAESLATQAGGVMRQASLYEDIRQLETLKSEMIRMASHDLKGPLNNAMGYLELLEEDLGDDPGEDMGLYISSIRRSINIMDLLIQDLLTLELVESQNKDAWETFDFAELTREVVDEQLATAQLNQQSLTLTLPVQPLMVRGSRAQLRQGIVNLVSNSLKYTPQGGNIQVQATVNGENRVLFEAQDDGYGIPKDRHEKLFQRFYRAKAPGTEHIAGTGLGLSLVKSIVERHGGQISFESEEGKGSTFSFWLPLTTLQG